MYNRYQCIPHNEGQRGGLTTPSGFLWPSIKNIRNIKNKHIQPEEKPCGSNRDKIRDQGGLVDRNRKERGLDREFVVELYEMDEELDGSITGSVTSRVGIWVPFENSLSAVQTLS